MFLTLLRSLISARYSWRGLDIVKTKTLIFVDSFFVVVRCSGALLAARDSAPLADHRHVITSCLALIGQGSLSS